MYCISNENGQSLIEYLIIVALMAVASIGIVRALNQSVNVQFARINSAIRGEQKKPAFETVDDSLYKKRDLSDFLNGAASHEGK